MIQAKWIWWWGVFHKSDSEHVRKWYELRSIGRRIKEFFPLSSFFLSFSSWFPFWQTSKMNEDLNTFWYLCKSPRKFWTMKIVFKGFTFISFQTFLSYSLLLPPPIHDTPSILPSPPSFTLLFFRVIGRRSKPWLKISNERKCFWMKGNEKRGKCGERNERKDGLL